MGILPALSCAAVQNVCVNAALCCAVLRRRYTLAEDIPEGHVTLQACPMIPASDGALVYDYFYDMAKDKWRTWGDAIDTTPIPPDAKFKKVIIPSVDTVSVRHRIAGHDSIP